MSRLVFGYTNEQLKNSFFRSKGIKLMEHIVQLIQELETDFDKLTKEGTAYVFRYLVAGF